MKTIIKNSCDGEKVFIHILEKDGRVLTVEQPAFDGPITVIKDALTDETWKKHGSDSNNYQWQIEEALRQFAQMIKKSPSLQKMYSSEEISMMEKGKCPSRLTVHHFHHKGKDMVMQLVDRKEHQDHKHRGGSAMANPNWREKKMQKDGNISLSTSERMCNKVVHTMHKHDKATSCAVGVGGGVLFHQTIGKKIKNKKIRYAASTVFGLVCSVATNMLLNKNNNNNKNIWV